MTSAQIAKNRLLLCQSIDKHLEARSTGPQGQRRGILNDRPFSKSRIAQTTTFDRAMTLSAVFACTKLLVETVASLPIEMFVFDKKRNRTQVYDHALIRLLRNKPNPNQTSIEFKETLMLNFINGNAYVRKHYYHGELIQLEVINNTDVTPRLNAQNKVEYQVRYQDGTSEILTDQEIWHLKLFGTGLIGMSPLAYGAQAIGIGLAADDKVGRVMENGAKPSGTLLTPNRLSKEQRQSLREEMTELVQGNDWFLPVLEGGLKFEKISLTPEEIELLSTRRFTVEEVCRFYGVPSVLINDTSGSTTWGSGIGQLVEAFYKFGLRPLFERIEESIRLNLLPRSDWDKYEFSFKLQDLLRASFETRITSNRTRIESGQSTVNEIRSEEGLQPIKGGDNLFVAANLLTIDRVINKEGSKDEKSA